MKVCTQHGKQGMPLSPNCPHCERPLLDAAEMLGFRPIVIPEEAIVPEGPHPRLPPLSRRRTEEPR